MTASYYNRYGDCILFEEIGNGEIYMTGFNFEWVIYDWKNSETREIKAVDPSGGPYLSVGGDLGFYFNDRRSRKIKEIKLDSENSRVIFKVKEE